MSLEKKKPWIKFYPADWQADQALRICTLAARGLWIECMAIMHRASPYGHLLVNGQAPTDTQLGVLVGAPPDQIPDLIRELESAGSFSRTRAGVIYSRRMTRDEKLSRLAVKNGKFGGNPSLSKDLGFTTPDNPLHKPPDKAQRLDARSQIKEEPPLPSGASPQLFPDNPKPPKRKSNGTTRGTLLPDDWQPSDGDRDFAAGRGLEGDDLKDQIANFIDYRKSVSGKNAYSRDWSRTYRNDVRRIAGRKKQPGGGQNRQGPPSIVEAYARAARRLRGGTPTG